MSTITLLSDLGPQSPVVIMAKGRLSALPGNPAIVDISHQIEPGDLREAAYVFGEVVHAFPTDTLHLMAFGLGGTIYIGRSSGQVVMSPSAELLSLLPENDGVIRKMEVGRQGWHPLTGSLIGSATGWFEDPRNFDQWGESVDQPETRTMPASVMNAEELKGTVLHVDGAGNAYTNIHKTDLERFAQSGRYRINLSRHEWVDTVSESFNAGRLGDITCSFSDGGHLVVVINNGDAGKLLGLRKGSIITIEYI